MRSVALLIAAAVFLAVAKAAIVGLAVVLLIILVHGIMNKPREIFGFIATMLCLRLILDHPLISMGLVTAGWLVTKIFEPPA